ncbi:MAG: hypothetical protein JWM19_5404 [Actinomycetia bacterium]|nr:hypothetical protein [Actinomycetes bacterium]
MLVFLRCWVLLCGALAMEVFRQLDFELTLSELAAKVGLSRESVMSSIAAQVGSPMSRRG